MPVPYLTQPLFKLTVTNTLPCCYVFKYLQPADNTVTLRFSLPKISPYRSISFYPILKSYQSSLHFISWFGFNFLGMFIKFLNSSQFYFHSSYYYFLFFIFIIIIIIILLLLLFYFILFFKIFIRLIIFLHFLHFLHFLFVFLASSNRLIQFSSFK